MIVLKNVTKIFDKKINIGVTDINFTFEQNDIVALIGNNGAGKTTIIKSIFNEFHLDNGEILIDNENMFINNNLRKISFFPDSNNIPLNLSTDKYMTYIARLCDLNNEEILNKKNKIFELLGITGLKDKKLKELSAGQKKKAIFAATLISGPKYIIFDEPTANLDIKTKMEFLNLVEELHNLNIGILITSHIIEELQNIANKLIIIDEGHLVYQNNFDKTKDNMLDIFNQFSKEYKKSNRNLLGEIING